jgi:hypothetical protein
MRYGVECRRFPVTSLCFFELTRQGLESRLRLAQQQVSLRMADVRFVSFEPNASMLISLWCLGVAGST